jgi:hypothetical protein
LLVVFVILFSEQLQAYKQAQMKHLQAKTDLEVRDGDVTNRI